MLYDIECPECGTINQNLCLEETDGWMECENCGAITQSLFFHKQVTLPNFPELQFANEIGAAI